MPLEARQGVLVCSLPIRMMRSCVTNNTAPPHLFAQIVVLLSLLKCQTKIDVHMLSHFTGSALLLGIEHNCQQVRGRRQNRKKLAGTTDRRLAKPYAADYSSIIAEFVMQ